MQLSKIQRRSALNENADATIEGIETEFKFFLSETLLIDGFVAYTDAKIDEFFSVDPLNPNAATQVLSNDPLFAPIGGTTTGFLSDWTQYSDACAAGLVTGGPCILAGAAANPLLGALVKYQNTDKGIVYKSFGPLCTQPFYGLDSTTLPCPVTDGTAQDLSGNILPLSHEMNYRLGITKFIERAGGTWTIRADYTYRDETFTTPFNRAADAIEDVSFIDLSVRYTASDDSWYAGVYARNLSDEDHIYAMYRTDNTVAGFANGVAMDPKIVGINFGINF